MIYGEYRSGIFKWAGAGHEHVLVKRKGGEVEIIRTGGVILGMVEDVGKYIEERKVRIGEGEKVVLYTDGITEARNKSDDMLRLKGLIEIVRGAPEGISAEELVEYIYNG